MSNIEKLSSSSSLKDLVDRQELLTNNIEEQKNTLKEILISKNVEVSEGENKLSILIDKVNELEENRILWLYKDGDECVDITNSWIFLNASSFKGSNQKLSDRVRCTVTTGGYTDTMFITNNKINLSKYSKAYLKFTKNYGAYGVRFGIRNTNLSYSNSDFVASITENSTNEKVTTFSVDISNLNNGYICVDVVGNDNKQVDIFEIWLEK